MSKQKEPKNNSMKKKMKQIKAASKRSKYSLLAVFIFAFAGIGGLIVLKSRAAPGLCSTSGVVGTATISNVSAPEAAQYRLWVRMQVPDTTNTGNTNGVRVELSGSSNQCFTVTTTSSGAVNQWQWVNSDATAASTAHITSTLATGNYTAKILGLKAGVEVDRVLLLKSDNTCTPSNTAPSGGVNPGDNCTTPAPSVNLTASQSSITSGSSVTLTWNTTNATSCTGSGGTGWSGSKLVNSNQTLTNRTTTETYTLNCTGVGGSSSDSVTVTVTPAPAPTVTLTANPTQVVSGNASALTWSTTNVNTNGCTASGSWTGTKAASGSQSTGNLTANQVYNISCTGPGGTATASVTVTVAPAPPPTDTTNPSVTFNIPGVTLTTGQTSVTVRDQKGVNWQPIATDNVGVSSLTLTVNGQTVTGSSIQVGVSANGDYDVRAVARDAAGNQTTQTLTIRVRHPDFNRSGSISGADVSGLLNRWGAASTVYDINLDNVVSGADLSYVLNRWGSTQ